MGNCFFLSSHKMNSITGRTFITSICPTTIGTQCETLSCHSITVDISIFVRPQLGLIQWEDDRPTIRRTHESPYYQSDFATNPLFSQTTRMGNVRPFQSTKLHFISVLFHEFCFIEKIESMIESKFNLILDTPNMQVLLHIHP